MRFPFLKTTVVARRLKVSYGRLPGLVRPGRLAPPERDSSGDYLWRSSEVRAAWKLLQEGTRAKADDTWR